MRQLFLFFFLVVACSSCTVRSTYRNLTEFNLQPTSLKDGEPVKILAAVIGNDRNEDAKYYNHLIVVSQVSGDTVNLLVNANPGLTDSDGEKVFNYISPSNVAYKAIASPDNLQNIKHVDDLPDAERFEKVIYASEYAHIAKPSFPTVIGMIGTVSMP